MTTITEIKPNDHESEVASNGYLLSFIVLFIGLHLPIVNLIASVIFFAANRKRSFFIRWHTMQVMFSQLILVPFNSIGFWWTIHILFSGSIFFSETPISSSYIAYMITLVIFNLIEFIAALYAAVKVRKGIHVEWFLFGPLANLLCKDKSLAQATT